MHAEEEGVVSRCARKMDNNSATSIAAATAAVREVRLNLLQAASMDSDQPLAHNFSPGALE